MRGGLSKPNKSLADKLEVEPLSVGRSNRPMGSSGDAEKERIEAPAAKAEGAELPRLQDSGDTAWRLFEHAATREPQTIFLTKLTKDNLIAGAGATIILATVL